MAEERVEPIGREIGLAARTIKRGFEQALGTAGGSFATWLVLLELRTNPGANQRELAAGIGIEPATLTHHLNAMERDGLLTRRRDPANRRVHLVELTKRGEATFQRLAVAAGRFDEQLRGGIGGDELAALRSTLAQLCANVDAGADDFR